MVAPHTAIFHYQHRTECSSRWECIIDELRSIFCGFRLYYKCTSGGSFWLVQSCKQLEISKHIQAKQDTKFVLSVLPSTLTIRCQHTVNVHIICWRNDWFLHNQRQNERNFVRKFKTSQWNTRCNKEHMAACLSYTENIDAHEFTDKFSKSLFVTYNNSAPF